MKTILKTYILLPVFLISTIQAQTLKTDSTYVRFFSEAPLENIEAENKLSKGIINLEKKEIAFVVPIKGFRFEKALMEEHFNENYMESDKYPLATFKGSFDHLPELKQGVPVEVVFKGKLSIHGVEKDREIPAKLTLLPGGQILGETKFMVKTADHNIEIPKLVVKNIAEEIEVTVKAYFSKK